MKREPICDISLVTDQQRFEAIYPGVGMLNNRTPFIELFIKIGPFYYNASAPTRVDSNVGLNLPLSTSQPKNLSVKVTICIEKQPVKINRLQQHTQFLKKFVNLKQIMRGGPCHDYQPGE
ncbi:hypothetical protein GCM10028819_05370 [Spirosoma humi]